jgi:lysophospholipid acyltransferase (LPLAT)-like uncharacterized protein
MFWHGKMFAGWYAARKQTPVALVSKSKDGELLATVLRGWGYSLTRGSSSKQGREALDRAIELVQTGVRDRLVITPDGPRGPYHRFKRGAFLAAKELDVPLYHLTISYHSRILFVRSWDKFELPRPFSKVDIVVRRIDYTQFPDDPNAQRSWLDDLAASLEQTSTRNSSTSTP